MFHASLYSAQGNNNRQRGKIPPELIMNSKHLFSFTNSDLISLLPLCKLHLLVEGHLYLHTFMSLQVTHYSDSVLLLVTGVTSCYLYIRAIMIQERKREAQLFLLPQLTITHFRNKEFNLPITPITTYK